MNKYIFIVKDDNGLSWDDYSEWNAAAFLIETERKLDTEIFKNRLYLDFKNYWPKTKGGSLRAHNNEGVSRKDGFIKWLEGQFEKVEMIETYEF